MLGLHGDPRRFRPFGPRAGHDKDFKLGLAAAQTTLSGVAQLTGATLKTRR